MADSWIVNNTSPHHDWQWLAHTQNIHICIFIANFHFPFTHTQCTWKDVVDTSAILLLIYFHVYAKRMTWNSIKSKSLLLSWGSVLCRFSSDDEDAGALLQSIEREDVFNVFQRIFFASHILKGREVPYEHIYPKIKQKLAQLRQTEEEYD